MSVRGAYLAVTMLLFSAEARELDRRCLKGDCVTLSVEGGRVFLDHTGEFADRREVGAYNAAGALLVPHSGAPIRYSKATGGDVIVVAAFLPRELDFNAPELRLYVFDSQGRQLSTDIGYTLLGSLCVGRIFRTQADFVVMSTTGAHSYVVRTTAWYLPPHGGQPRRVLEVVGLLTKVQVARGAEHAGLWIDRETYDGVNWKTKGQLPEFWAWDEPRGAMVKDVSP